jgi:hypothetical protein
MSRIKALVSYKCPQCETGNIYQKGIIFWFGKMNPTFPKCNCLFEIEPGFFFGAMFVCYALTVAEAIGAYIFSQFFFDSLTALISIIFMTLILLSPINYKFSRVIWMYIFISKKKA